MRCRDGLVAGLQLEERERIGTRRADEGLESVDLDGDAREDDGGIDRLLRVAPVHALALHEDLEARAARHPRAVVPADVAEVARRVEVKAPGLVHAVEDAALQELGRAVRRRLLGRLEEEADVPLGTDLREEHRRAEVHRDVSVVSARVHLAGNLRLVGVVSGLVLLYRQRVDVAAERDRALRGVRSLQLGHDAGLHGDGLHFDAGEGGEDLPDLFRRAEFLEAEFRMTVQVAPDVAQRVGDLGRLAEQKVFVDHFVFPSVLRTFRASRRSREASRRRTPRSSSRSRPRTPRCAA